jgi:mycothiol synthase
MVTYRLLQESERDEALRMMLGAGGVNASGLRARIAAFHEHADRMALRVERQWGAFEGGRLVTSCLTTASPGRTALVFLPPSPSQRKSPEVLVGLLRQIVADGSAADIRLYQVLLSPDEEDDGAILEAAGFRYLAELIYMHRDSRARMSAYEEVPDLEWVTYREDRHALFASTVAATYEDSLDCPGLTGLRTIDDILASHRAAGEFDPRRWFVTFVEGKPAGVLLVARVPQRDAAEIVYIGVAPPFRRRGIGRALLRRAILVARDIGGPVTVAVDSQNTPALQLYRGVGFAESSRRRAWIAVANASRRTRS